MNGLKQFLGHNEIHTIPHVTPRWDMKIKLFLVTDATMDLKGISGR
jgi:hypothetical protein